MNTDAHEELLFIQEARLDDIRDLKRYQWQSSYYAVLALGGLVALSRISSTPLMQYRLVLAVAGVLVFVAWFFINQAIERALTRSREARERGYALFNDAVRNTRPSDAIDRGGIYRALLVVVLGAAVVATIAILAH